MCLSKRPLLHKCVSKECAYSLQELAELAAFGISGAEILFWCHHCADAASICVLSWAVHLPSLLWPDSLHTGTRAVMSAKTRRLQPELLHKSNNNDATVMKLRRTFVMYSYFHFFSFFSWVINFSALCQQTCFCYKILVYTTSASWPWQMKFLGIASLGLLMPLLKVVLGDADKPDLWEIYIFLLHWICSTAVEYNT